LNNQEREELEVKLGEIQSELSAEDLDWLKVKVDEFEQKGKKEEPKEEQVPFGKGLKIKKKVFFAGLEYLKKNEDKVEEYIEDLVGELTPAQKERLHSNIKDLIEKEKKAKKMNKAIKLTLYLMKGKASDE